MRQASLLLLPVLLLAVLVTVVVAEIPKEAGLPAGAQLRLDQFIAHELPPGDTTVQAAERAKRPEHFERDAGYTVFGDSGCYETDRGLNGNDAGGPMPLPYPPEQLWCILLQHKDAKANRTSYAIVFAAMHMDMHNADWMIHDGPRDLSILGLAESLAQLGCSLGLDQAGPRLTNHSQ
jgi:hypothetical protein